MLAWPNAEPFDFPGSAKTGVLVIHGFTASPATVVDWAQGIAQTGWTVVGPLLPGHGTVWTDLNRVSWRDWEAEVEMAYQALSSRVEQIFVAALSMGAALAFLLAQKHPEIKGVVVVNHLMLVKNPFLFLAPIIRHLVPSVAAIANDIKDPTKTEPAYPVTPTGGADEFRKLLAAVKPGLGRVRQPVLIMKSREDHVLPLKNVPWTMARLGSQDKTVIWLENSYHVATMDYDLPIIVDQTVAFIKRLGG